MIKKVQRKSKKRIPLQEVPIPIQDAIISALAFEKAISDAVLALVDQNQEPGVHSAGLALAVASMTSPKNKLFAKMISEVSAGAIADYQQVRRHFASEFPITDRRLMH